MEVCDIDKVRFNPFGATEQELLAYALDDAWLIRFETTIDGSPAREYLRSFYRKREDYRESTKLGEMLVCHGVIDQPQLAAVLCYQLEHPGMKLGEAILALGFCRITDIEATLEAQTHIRDDLEDLASYKAQIATIRERLKSYL
jgi:hypothetical protein